MQQLLMNKKIIRGVIDYSENFSAKDVLRDRVIAGGFFLNKMRHISILTEYHTEMFFRVLFSDPPELSLFLRDPSAYLTPTRVSFPKFTNEKMTEIKKLMEEEKLGELVEKTWKIADGTSLEGIEKARLFCLLTAAYGLACRSADEEGFEITSAQAELAYLGKPEPEPEVIKEIAFPADDFNIEIAARKQPYEIHLRCSEATELLKNGTATITHKKLTAGKHVHGKMGVNVTLHIYNENDSEPSTVELKPYEYVFINTVGEYPVLVHPRPEPVCIQDGSILSCAEKFKGSYLTVRLGENSEGVIDDSKYADKDDGLDGFPAVEICFKKHYIYLDPEGFIHEKHMTTDKTERYVTIKEYLSRR